MDLKGEILKENSKAQALRITAYIGNDEDKFAKLIQLFLSDDYRVTQRAAWILSHCCDEHPELIKPHLTRIVKNLDNNPNIAVKRNTVRILQFIQLPESLMGPLADHCFNYLRSPKETIAVKVFSMTILSNICRYFPELSNELIPIIEEQMPYGSAGFKSRGKKVLKELSRN
ncbi:MAG: hypothetical protein RJQ09_14915 [Cyclobacteriaceae bacterium]